MPSRRARARRAVVEPTQNRNEFRAHLEKLGLQSEADYRKWCRTHGLGLGVFKSATQKRRELDLAEQERDRAILSRRRKNTRKPPKTLRQLYDGSLPRGPLGAEYLHEVRDRFDGLQHDPPARRAFLDILLAAEEHGRLFGLDPALPHLGDIPTNRFIAGMAQIARHHRQFVRPAPAWRPDSRNPRRQFGHLARHLLAGYPDVPAFMDAAWFEDVSEATDRHQHWFLHLGAGGNIRTAPSLPVSLTKRMAHAFLQGPGDLDIGRALRWAQVTGQDGSDALAQAVIASRLGDHFEAEDFWSSVIVFFVRNPMLDPAQVGPIVDFAHHQKFVPEEHFFPDGSVEHRPPSQPNFAMKSRSVDKLLRQVDEWHSALNQRFVDPFAEDAAPRGSKRWQNLIKWDRCDIDEFDHEETNPNTGESVFWMIRELCSNRALNVEGRSMHHCVSSYVKSCRNGNTSVWSLSARLEKKRIPVLTIAVDPRTRAITQARGKCNASLDAPTGRRGKRSGGDRFVTLARPVLERWVRQEQLQMRRLKGY